MTTKVGRCNAVITFSEGRCVFIGTLIVICTKVTLKGDVVDSENGSLRPRPVCHYITQQGCSKYFEMGEIMMCAHHWIVTVTGENHLKNLHRANAQLRSQSTCETSGMRLVTTTGEVAR